MINLFNLDLQRHVIYHRYEYIPNTGNWLLSGFYSVNQYAYLLIWDYLIKKGINKASHFIQPSMRSNAQTPKSHLHLNNDL